MQIAAVSSVDDDDGWMHFGNTSVKFLDCRESRIKKSLRFHRTMIEKTRNYFFTNDI